MLLIIVLLLCNFSILSAQNKQIAIGEIYDGTFTVESLDKLRSMDNGKQYTILNIDRSLGISTIEKYDYKTQKNWKPLFLLPPRSRF